VGIVTTVVTLQGGSGALSGSTNILDCSSAAQDVPDVNIGTHTSFIYCDIRLTRPSRNVVSFEISLLSISNDAIQVYFCHRCLCVSIVPVWLLFSEFGVTGIYFAMIFRKAQDLAIENSKTMWQILWASDLLPTIHLCLKDACAYFLVYVDPVFPPP
jgi:hypothetical protein